MKIFLLSLLVMAAGSVRAQKYGHMNLGNLLEMMPETKKANQDLKVFSDALSAKDDSMTAAFQSEYKKLEEDYSGDKVPPVQFEQRKAQLQKKQEDIQKFEQEAQQQIAAKRDELLKPILDRVEQTVKKVAKANGFVMVFDSSTGVMLFADDAIDVMPLVKAALGLSN